MSQFLQIHPDNPQARLIQRSVEIIQDGGVIVYPTDSGYALGCHIGDKQAMERIRVIRKLDDKHHFTLVCRDLSEVSVYAKVGNVAYRLIKSLTPGPYTFILLATREVPRRLQHSKRKTIGLRVPDNVITQQLLEVLGEPIMSTTLIMPGDDIPLTDPYDIRHILEHSVDLVIDGGYCGIEPSTVVDLVSEQPEIMRYGKGDVEAFLT
jgi:tRNA threonylcarbamoyl adenosine modification protein (Sua5/YciO/YrdC/YwlC family)